MKILKQCNADGCKELIERNESHCDIHIGETDRQYNKYRKEAEPEVYAFYHSTAWKRARETALRQQKYLCQDCIEYEGIYNLADVVDHVIELKDDWSKRLEIDNLRALCHAHHNTKTAEEVKKRRR